MQVGFCVMGDNEGVRFNLLGRTTLGRLLSTEQAGHSTAVIVGRLHYRKDLLRTLDRSEGVDDKTSDAGLILAAYRHSGWEALSRLEGTFALALWDAKEKRLYARRDLLGGFPLYWGQRGLRMAVGTNLQQVCNWTSATALDPEYEAEYLMLPTCAEHEVAGERTPYRGVQRVQPQTLLDANLSTSQVQVRKHWEWLDHMETPASSDLSAISARYLELLRDAVRERMVGTTAAHVSGGMDSTSVALLAAADIERGAAQGPLHTISLVYDDMIVLSKERDVIREAVSGNANMVPHLIKGDGLLDFAPYVAPPAHEEPWPWLSMAGTEMARLDTAVNAGAQTILTGQGADELLDMGPYHLTDLLRRGRLVRAWRESCAAANAENCGVWPILFPFGIRNLLPMSFRDGFGPLWRGGYTDWLHMGDCTIPPWIRRSYARQFSLRDRALVRAGQHYHKGRSTILSLALERIATRSGDLGRWNLSAPRGILVEHPFLDPRLIRFMLGVHATVPPMPRTSTKPILVEAMQGILPDSIRLRNKAGFFNEPYFRGIAQHAGVLERLLTSSEHPTPDWLDKDELLYCLRQSALGIGNYRIQMDRLNVTFSWLKWQSMRSDNSAMVHPVQHGPRRNDRESARPSNSLVSVT